MNIKSAFHIKEEEEDDGRFIHCWHAQVIFFTTDLPIGHRMTVVIGGQQKFIDTPIEHQQQNTFLFTFIPKQDYVMLQVAQNRNAGTK